MAGMLHRAFSRTGRTGSVIPAAVAAVVAPLVLVALLWIRPDSAPRAAAQEESPPASLAAPASPGADDVEEAGTFSGGAPAEGPAGETAEGIPGAGAVEIVANLKHLRPEEDFPCEGPTTGENGLITWGCATPGGHYAVEVVAEDPLTVLSVTAAAYDVPGGEAEEFFGYVLGLCLKDGAALDPTAFATGSVPGGGRTSSVGAEISIYGSEGARAMSVVSTGPSYD